MSVRECVGVWDLEIEIMCIIKAVTMRRRENKN